MGCLCGTINADKWQSVILMGIVLVVEYFDNHQNVAKTFPKECHVSKGCCAKL